ncbi:MAG TPA: cell division protein FtsQ/DivIB [Burkholderiales bacterium]|nr:cell division protein FtsQ/DivIB [Burkholderiales bacterium]
MWDDEVLLAKWTRAALAGTAMLLLCASLVMVSRLKMFDLHEIRIIGAQHVTMNQAKLVIRQYITGNFFSVNLATVRAAFLKLPWARDASVRRRWPDGLEVVLEEHAPLARWNDNALLNRYGEVFTAASNADLPHLSGPSGSEREVLQRWIEFSRILRPLKRIPLSVTLNDRRSWSLVMDNGVTIALGSEHPAWKLQRWAGLYPEMAAQLTAPVAAVDLRYQKGFAVRLAESGSGDASHAEKKQGKSL